MKILFRLKERTATLWTIIFLAMTTISATAFLPSGIYRWEEAKIIKKSTGPIREIIKGQTRSLEMFEIKAVTLFPGKGLASYLVEAGVDEMFIIMEGSAEFYVGYKPKILTKGSVAVIPQGDKVRLKNGGRKELIYYIFRFKTGSKSPNKISSFISVWDTVTFKPSANGGRRNIINQERSALKNLEIHVTTLKERLPSHAAHKHADEEIILIRKGIAEESINGVSQIAQIGSAIFLSHDDVHGIRNAGKGDCEYYAIRWITEKGSSNK